MAFQRGLDANQEQNSRMILRDTRSVGQKLSAFFADTNKTSLILLISTMLIYVLPPFAEIILLMDVGIFIYCITRKMMLPFRMPMSSKRKDHNDNLPGSTKARTARGIYFLGNENKTQDELWFSNEDMRTHVLIFGSTGSGKTEALVSMAYNALLQASGFIYVDGKGDNGLFAKIFSMVRSMGREDDLLLVNFMTGARDILGAQEKRLSNTLNPFASGSSSMLSNLVVSLMDDSSSSSDGDMWKGRAIGFVEALMRVLVSMRDAGHILLDANSIRNYFLLPRLEAMVVDKLFIRDGQESVSMENLPPSLLEPITNYVLNLPGYNKQKKGKQVSQVLEQHGFITMQLTRVFTSLADTYGHILRTNLAEVDLSDVVLNRRILCVLLPALEKSPSELSNLGKIIIATLKAMMAAGLGDSVEGDIKDIVDSRPTNAETPFLCILDEYGYYAVEGFAVVPAQARSLGFSVVFAGQDLPAFQKASKEEAASIGANTNIKICMKLEDPTETWDFFMKSAGESYVTQVESFQVDAGSVIGNYADGKGARVEKRARVDLLDLKEQVEGDFHIFFKSKIIRGRTFYANPKPVKKMRLNHFLKVAMPEDADVDGLLKSFDGFAKLDADNIDWPTELNLSEDLSLITNTYATMDAALTAVETAMVVFQTAEEDVQGDIPDDFLMELLSDDDHDGDGVSDLSIFKAIQMNDYLENIILESDREFCNPILDRSESRSKIEYLERLGGSSGSDAMNIAIELIRDLDSGTHYPPKVDFAITPEQLAAAVGAMNSQINIKKQDVEE
jgi:intracellular multiplication protein IcmO